MCHSVPAKTTASYKPFLSYAHTVADLLSLSWDFSPHLTVILTYAWFYKNAEGLLICSINFSLSNHIPIVCLPRPLFNKALPSTESAGWRAQYYWWGTYEGLGGLISSPFNALAKPLPQWDVKNTFTEITATASNLAGIQRRSHTWNNGCSSITLRCFNQETGVLNFVILIWAADVSTHQ